MYCTLDPDHVLSSSIYYPGRFFFIFKPYPQNHSTSTPASGSPESEPQRDIYLQVNMYLLPTVPTVRLAPGTYCLQIRLSFLGQNQLRCLPRVERDRGEVSRPGVKKSKACRWSIGLGSSAAVTPDGGPAFRAKITARSAGSFFLPGHWMELEEVEGNNTPRGEVNVYCISRNK